MCKAITSERKLNFENLTKDCYFCKETDGKSYIYTKTCPTCEGKKKFLKGTRRYRCKECAGNGYVMLDTPIENGPCHRCDGARVLPLDRSDNMTREDKEWVFENLFNFEKPYTQPTSSFNENYLGMGIICGITDYGRYKALTSEEFKTEVKSSFMGGWLQYMCLTNKEQELPVEILIKCGESGWHAYPVYRSNC